MLCCSVWASFHRQPYAVADTDSGGTSDYILSLRFGGFSDRIIRPAYLAAIYFADLFKNYEDVEEETVK